MKKMILTAALFTGLSFATYAQDNTTSMPKKQGHERQHMTPDQRAAKDSQRAQQQLGLNAEQASKWQAAALERAQANEPLKEKFKAATTQDEKNQLRGQMKSNGDKFETTINGFLTPDQKTKYDQNKKDKHNMHKGGMRPSGGQPGQ